MYWGSAAALSAVQSIRRNMGIWRFFKIESVLCGRTDLLTECLRHEREKNVHDDLMPDVDVFLCSEKLTMQHNKYKLTKPMQNDYL